MIEIIPAILAQDEKEFRRKVESVSGSTDILQIDVMDGQFVEQQTWADPDRLQKMPLPMDFEVHLMVADPMAYLDGWSLAGCRRVLIHAESVDDLGEALRQVKSYGMEAGISLNPETPVADIEDAVPEADVVQVMGVHPGAMGQAFQEGTLEKVRLLREKFPELIIEVDGGVSVGIAKRLADAGADRLVSGSAIFNSGAPAKALDSLRRDVEAH
jgi:ribulose-phosphate 3-epimerase